MTHDFSTDERVEKLLAFAISERIRADGAGADPKATDNVISLNVARRDAPEELEATDELVRRRTLTHLLDRYFDESPQAGRAPGADRAEPTKRREVSEARGGVASPSSLRWLRWPLLSAAAALLLVVAWPTGPGESPQLALLEEYTVSPVGAWGGSMRGRSPDPGRSDECRISFHPERSFGAILRPHVDMKHPVVVVAELRSADGRSMWVDDLDAIVRDSGTIEIRKPAAALGLTPGAWEARFFVMRQGEALSREALASLGEGLHPGVTVVEMPFCVVEG